MDISILCLLSLSFYFSIFSPLNFFTFPLFHFFIFTLFHIVICHSILIFEGLGSCLAINRELEESLRVFNEMLGWQPDNIEGLMKAGEVLGAAGHYKVAHKTFLKIINLGGETYTIRMSMGSFLFKEKLFASALEEFIRSKEVYLKEKSIKNIGSSSVDTVNTMDDTEGLIINRIGKCYKDMGESLLAVKAFRQCLEVDPKSKEYLMDLASVLMERGESLWWQCCCCGCCCHHYCCCCCLLTYLSAC